MAKKSAPFVSKMHDLNSKYLRQRKTSLFSFQPSLQLLTVNHVSFFMNTQSYTISIKKSQEINDTIHNTKKEMGKKHTTHFLILHKYSGSLTCKMEFLQQH